LPDDVAPESLFLLIARYRDPEGVAERANAHRALVQELYERGWVLASGPMIGEPGGVIVMRARDREQLENVLLSRDPFEQGQVVEYTITQFEPTGYPRRSAAFDQFVADPPQLPG